MLSPTGHGRLFTHMARSHFGAAEVLLRKGDRSDALYYIVRTDLNNFGGRYMPPASTRPSAAGERPMRVD
jgi:hypothetical protein